MIEVDEWVNFVSQKEESREACDESGDVSMQLKVGVKRPSSLWYFLRISSINFAFMIGESINQHSPCMLTSV